MSRDPLYRFGRCELDVSARRVRLDGQPRAIEPRPLELLEYLILHRRRVVTKEELLEQVWPGEAVSTGALARAVMKARQAIGDDGEPALIRSVPRVGYRFVAELAHEAAARHEAAPARPADALTVALLPFENATGDAALGWIELGLMGLAANALASHPKLAPVALPSLMIAVQGARAQPGARLEDAVRQATGARIVVRSRVLRARTGYRLDFDASDTGPLGAAQVYAEKPAELAARMVAALSEMLCPEVLMAESAGLVLRDPLATESFARGIEALAQHQWGKAANLFKLTLDLEPLHPGAKLELLHALGITGDLEALRLSRGLLARAERENDLLLAARVHQAIGRLYLNRGELNQAAYRLETALRLADGRETPDWTARTLMLQASVAVHQLDHERAADALQRMYRECRRSGDLVLPVAGLNFEAIAASARGEHERAVELSAEAARRARALGAHSYRVDACDNAAWDLARLGRLAEAAAYGEEGISSASVSGDLQHAADSVPVVCWIYLMARAPQAVARLVRALPDPQQMARPEPVWRAQGLLALVEGRHADAVAALRRAVQRHREVGDGHHEEQALPWLIDALVLAGAHAEAEAELAAVAGRRLAPAADLRQQTLHAKALLAHARGQAGQALALLSALIDARPAPLWLAWACIDAAWLLAEAGSVAQAERQLERLPAPLAGHPLAQAAQARVHHAAGRARSAAEAQRACLATLGAAAPGYLERLLPHYERSESMTPFPPAPVLPSRL